MRYVVVELLTALFWVALFYRFGWRLEFFQFALLVSALIAVFAIDLEHYIIPDQLWIFGAVVGFAADAVGLVMGWRTFPWNDLLWLRLPFGRDWRFQCRTLFWASSRMAALCLRWGYWAKRCSKRRQWGVGDVKLTAAIGCNIGAAYGIVSFFLAAAIGAAAGIVLMAAGRKQRMDEIPFGPCWSPAR